MARKRTSRSKVEIDFDEEGRVMLVTRAFNAEFLGWLKNNLERQTNAKIRIDEGKRRVTLASFESPYEGIPIPRPPVNPMCGDRKLAKRKKKSKPALSHSPR